MEVIPAIDLKGGRCVRLFQGDYNQETVFSDDPAAVAEGWQAQGARWLHLVDLDGAAQGQPVNLAIIQEIVRRLTIPIQVGGGVRNRDTAAALLDAGVSRVVLGTAAAQEPQLIERLCQEFGPERVVVAVDARNGQVAIKGWQETTSVTALDLARQMAALGVARLLYTDIARDGTLTEPNFAANEELARVTGLAVLASGGIASVEHVRRLATTGVEGAILGRALYTGQVKLPEALAAGK